MKILEKIIKKRNEYESNFGSISQLKSNKVFLIFKEEIVEMQDVLNLRQQVELLQDSSGYKFGYYSYRRYVSLYIKNKNIATNNNEKEKVRKKELKNESAIPGAKGIDLKKMLCPKEQEAEEIDDSDFEVEHIEEDEYLDSMLRRQFAANKNKTGEE